MKKLFLYILFFICGFEGFGQNAGVTVITHGFDLLAGTGQSGIDSWIEHGYEVQKRYNDTHPGQLWATVFINDPKTGLWKRDEDLRNGYGSPESELIFVYDWTVNSNNISTPNDRGLEVSADHLFALLAQPNVYSPSNIAGQMLKDKETHFIGHSRGGILLLQVLHRIAAYFPTVKIEHLTLLDPHPAAQFEDVKKDNNAVINLPGVFGEASNCGVLCYGGVYSDITGVGVHVKIPENVSKVDNYYRTEISDGIGDNYEPLTTKVDGKTSISAFSGVPIVGENFNRKLNNTPLSNGVSTTARLTGGSHSGVHEWYFYSLSRIGQFPTIGSLFPLNCYIDLPSRVSENNWFTSETAPFLDYSLLNLTGEGCFNTGYYYSRLGGGYNNSKFDLISNASQVDLQTMNQQLSQRLRISPLQNTNEFPEPLINGNLLEVNRAAIRGWFNSDSFFPNKSNAITASGTLNLPYLGHVPDNIQLIINHNSFYLSHDYLKVKVSSYNRVNPNIILKVKNNQGVLVKTISYELINNQTQEVIFDLRQFKNNVISFSLSRSDVPIVTEVIYIHSVIPTSQITVSAPPSELIGYRVQKNVQLAWKNNSSDGLGYSIERSLSPTGQFTQIGVVGPNQSSYVDISPPVGVLYYYKVRKLNGNEYTNFIAPSEQTSGITVMTHGFQLFGSMSGDWKKYANAVRNRLSKELGLNKGATILVSKPNGRWAYLENGDKGNGIFNPNNEEIIFLFDWASASNNSLLNDVTGYLEQSADLLFAMLVNPVIEFSNGGTVNIGGAIPASLITSKNTHFIGHSRGGVLLLQTLYRLRTNFPSFDLERLTLLDAHPAGYFGDVKRANISGSYSNLPGVNGQADNCISILCSSGNQSVYLTVPDNVLKVENFYRQDPNNYEPLGSYSNGINAFSGVPLINGSNSYRMDNGVMNAGVSNLPGILGGAHGAVPEWYFKTFDFTWELSTSEKNYLYKGLEGDFMILKNRFNSGYNQTLPANTSSTTLSNYNQAYQQRTGKPSVETLFNGDFGYGNASGWRFGYIGNLEPTVANEELILYPQLDLDDLSHTMSAKHNTMYFPLSSTSISLDVKRSTSSYSGTVNPLLSIEFYDVDNQKIYTTARAVGSTEFETFTFGIPPGLKGKNGAVQLVFANNGANTDFNQSNLRIIVDNVEFGDITQTVSPPTITASKTTITGGQSVLLTATGCENGTVYWSNEQSGVSISVSPVETTGYTAFCALDGFYSTPSNAVAITVTYTHNMANAEYFFDTDPGYGNGFALPVNTTGNINQTFNIGLSPHNLSQGVHTFGVRVKDNKNDWSLTHTRPFLVLGFGSGENENITHVEYFYDSLKVDKSNLISQAVSPDGFNSIALPLTINLTQGVHTVSFRAKDNTGKYSLFHTRPFLVLGAGSGASETITQVEYFYDSLKTDKSNLITANVSPDGLNNIVLPLTVNLSQGVHTITVRAKDNTGKYSLFHTRPFLVLGFGSGNPTAISQIEYFFDTDPGYGNATQVTYAADGSGTAILNLNLASMSAGVHTIYVRVKDNNGRWSLTHVRPFVIMPDLGTNTATISRIEYFINGPDPGLNNATSVSFSPVGGKDVSALFDVTLDGLANGIHNLYARVLDSEGRWSPLRSVSFELYCPANSLFFTIKSGSWDDTSVWSCGSVPSVLDAVRINNSHTIILPTDYTATAKSLELQGSIQYNVNAKIQLGQQ